MEDTERMDDAEEMGWEISQIMPADGWCAVYFADAEPYYEIWRLVGWALKEWEDGSTEVVGLEAADVVDEVGKVIPNFYMYAHRDEITEALRQEWSAEGKRRAQGQHSP